MTIKFECPKCGKKIGVPDPMAGKCGKCPGCGFALTVPSASPPAPAARPPSQEDTDYSISMESSAPGPTRVITFSCTECWREITVATTGDRERSKCPGCGALVLVPSESTLPVSSQTRATSSAPESVAGQKKSGGGVLDLAASAVRVVGCLIVLVSLAGWILGPLWLMEVMLVGVIVGFILMFVKARA